MSSPHTFRPSSLLFCPTLHTRDLRRRQLFQHTFERIHVSTAGTSFVSLESSSHVGTDACGIVRFATGCTRWRSRTAAQRGATSCEPELEGGTTSASAGRKTASLSGAGSGPLLAKTSEETLCSPVRCWVISSVEAAGSPELGAQAHGGRRLPFLAVSNEYCSRTTNPAERLDRPRRPLMAI